MPSHNKNRRQAQPPPATVPAPAPAPASTPVAAPPTPKATAKYTNKDGTKYISVPKSSASTTPTQPSPAPPAEPQPAVNHKKQKRRAKAAAKAAAKQLEDAANGAASPVSTSSADVDATPTPSASAVARTFSGQSHPRSAASIAHSHGEQGDWGDDTESDDDAHYDPSSAGQPPANGSTAKSKKSKKKKKKGAAVNLEASSSAAGGIIDYATTQSAPNPTNGLTKEKIWNTSVPEERERIKQFWLGLGDKERKSLVKVEKDAVLKKMKEQQKHTCSCSVCGRKRTAIEEELEGLYDAYYEELESFANQPHHPPEGTSMFGAPGPKKFGTMTGLHPPPSLPSRYAHHHPPRGRMVEHVDNDEEVDEEDEEDLADEDDEADDYSEEDEDDLDDEEDDEDEPEEIPREPFQNDFFHFGQSLTVKGGILTVADDLLKNDGKKFIEMMEQLAERRMAREEDSAKDHYARYGHSVNDAPLPPHNHPPPEEDDYDEEEEGEDEYDSQEDEYEDEEETMTEEQRMEEGRRMFQIFAARMFEQRVLTAYREKVANERQQQLLEELALEDDKKLQQAAKKATAAQRKKDRAAQKKQAQLEEKARKESEKAAEEAARAAEEVKRVEEAKRKAEEKRKKKDAQKKAEEDERLRKESERQRRAHEQKERQAEQERKAREAKEREKKAKEEQRRKEQEARDLKERETRERREKHEKDKREKELRAAQAKADRDAKEKQKQEDKAQKAAALAATATATAPATAPGAAASAPITAPSQPAKKPAPVPATTTLPYHHASPQIPVATPALPKAPTPMKPRAVSHEVTRSVSQASHSASGPSQNASPHPLTPAHSSPGPAGLTSQTPSVGPMSAGIPVQPNSPLHSTMKSPPGLGHGPFSSSLPPMNMPFGPGHTIPPPGFAGPQGHMFPPAPNFRSGGIPGAPPGLGGPMPMGSNRHFPPPGPPGYSFPPAEMLGSFSPPDSVPPARPSPHSRQGSASYDAHGDLPGSGGGIIHPVSKPAPIGRPSSVVHGQRSKNAPADTDDVNKHLGSSALLDDSDEPLGNMPQFSRTPGTAVPGSRPPGLPFMDPVFGSPLGGGWGGPQGAFSPTPPGFGNAWPTQQSAFNVGPPPGLRSSQPRSVLLRQLLVRACKDLSPIGADGFVELSTLKRHVDANLPAGAEPASEHSLKQILDTEGSMQNGGGNFSAGQNEHGETTVRHEPDVSTPAAGFARPVGAPGAPGAPGQIGSPGAAARGSLFHRGF